MPALFCGSGAASEQRYWRYGVFLFAVAFSGLEGHLYGKWKSEGEQLVGKPQISS